MKRTNGIIGGLLFLLASTGFAADPGKLTVHLDQPGEKIGELFYGLMTEEINYSYDGGLYAEVIRNRIFQDNANTPVNWSVIKSGDGSDGAIALDRDRPVNNAALNTSLRIDVTNVGANGHVGVANSGYWGIPVKPNTKYRVSFYARASDGFSGNLAVGIESNEGKPVVSATVNGVGKEWKKHELVLTTGDVPVSTKNRFVITTAEKGSVWLSLVSVFPPTYKDRLNGNRIDLMEKLAALNPKFLRFPGGNYLEGDYIKTRFEWKKTIGPLEDRPGHMGCWGYRSSDGMGLLDFLHWCEDLNMEPILGVYAGYSLKGEYVKPGPDLEPFVKEALEEIEYCIGDAQTTEWGARRAKDGHPAPFKIRYVEVGNEDWFDRSGSYDGRFAQFYDAIKAKYPDMQVISTMPVTSRKADLVDDHAYLAPAPMLRSVDRYRNRDPKLPKVFFGEWATQSGRPTPNLRGAIADAAWLTGLQRDSETVLMNCYAPLLVNINPGGSQWPTNLIGYDAANSFGSPSFYAQAMFANNLGDQNVKYDLVTPKVEAKPEPPHGSIGVGTWQTAADFKDITVRRGEQELFKSDFSAGTIPDTWRGGGNNRTNWQVKEGVLSQTDPQRRETRLTTGDAAWDNYTVSVKARKTSGSEGFLVWFYVRDRQTFARLNVGGWGNTRSGLERADGGEVSGFGSSKPIKVEANRWYDVRVTVEGENVKAYVDEALVAEGKYTTPPPPRSIFCATSRDKSTGDVILKIINSGDVPQSLQIDLPNAVLASDGTLEQLTGKPDDVNSIAEPTKIAPKKSKVAISGNSFTQEFPANSVNVIRIGTK